MAIIQSHALVEDLVRLMVKLGLNWSDLRYLEMTTDKLQSSPK